jgi:hypothetical protein
MSETQTETQSVPSEPQGPAVKAAQIAAEAPPPPKKGFLQRLFDPTTRFGRGMRAFTRGLGLVVGLYALGLLTTYVLLYQPMERRHRAAQAELDQMSAAVETLRGDLKLSQSSLAGSEQQRQTAADELARAQARVDGLNARALALETRLALARKDDAAARLALGDLEQALKTLKPALNTTGGESLDKVLALVKSDLSRDARLADEDLQRLLSELELIDQALQ